MFRFPDKYVTPKDRILFCFRFQEYWHEQSVAGKIPDPERVFKVAEMLPFLGVEQGKIRRGDYKSGEAPSEEPKKSDWDGEKLAFAGDSNDKGAVYEHAYKVLILQGDALDKTELDSKVADARHSCLHDITLDEDIKNG